MTLRGEAEVFRKERNGAALWLTPVMARRGVARSVIHAGMALAI